MKILLYALYLFQVSCCSLLIFGDIGFDKPGKYGLEWSAFVVIMSIYVVALVSGLILSIWKKRRAFVVGQFLPMLGVLAFIYLPYLKYDPAKYQDLVGKPREEVERRLGHPRGEMTGAESTDRHKDVETISVRGMEVYMRQDGIVLSVESNDR